MTKLSEIENEVFKINLEDRNEILKWFAKAYYFNDELLEHGAYDEMFIRLSSKYKPLTEDAKALLSLRDIKQDTKSPSEGIMSLIVLEQIMIGLKGEIGLDVEHGIDKMLFDYHAKYNRDFINELYMEHLNEYLGKKVYVVGRYDKRPMLEVGELQSLDDYHSIRVNDQDIMFVGYKHYIKSIRDENNKVLYYNGKEYDMSLLIDPADIGAEKIMLFNKTNATRTH